MGRPYAKEMANLPVTYRTSSETHATDSLNQELLKASLGGSMYAVGAGGSSVTADFVARLHAELTGLQSQSVTTYEFLHRRLSTDDVVVVASAGGGNLDVLRALEHALDQECQEIILLTCRPESPAAKLARKLSRLRVFLAADLEKDGFLATNSLLASVTSWYRAAAAVSPQLAPLPSALQSLEPSLHEPSATADTYGRPHIIALAGDWCLVGAADFESRCSEAGLASVQMADWRSFAHGRHQWLAHHPDDTIVVAFIDEATRPMAEATLDLLPPHVPVTRVNSTAAGPLAAISSVVGSMRLVATVAAARGIDPGRPRVSDWGRKAYHLGPLEIPASPPRTRKDAWRRWSKAKITGIVLDYDGTIVETPHRFNPPRDDVVAELARLSAFVPIGIATGRGKSVRNALRHVLPEPTWESVTIGYYNGTEIATLSETNRPDGSPELRHSGLQEVWKHLENHVPSEIEVAKRPRQISLSGLAPYLRRLEEPLSDALAKAHEVQAVHSSTSIDVLPRGVSKMAVVEAVGGKHGTDGILRIGDMGQPGGNDRTMLLHPFGISVHKPAGAEWGAKWSAPRIRGTDATLEVLRALQPANSGLRLTAPPGWRS